ncbi:MAG: hypothetical protein QOD84_125, partial [Acidobacteriaceae bacterium]
MKIQIMKLAKIRFAAVAILAGALCLVT